MHSNFFHSYSEKSTLVLLGSIITVPKNNLNLRIKTRPVTVGVNCTTENAWILGQKCINKKSDLLICALGLTFMHRFRLFWDSVGSRRDLSLAPSQLYHELIQTHECPHNTTIPSSIPPQSVDFSS